LDLKNLHALDTLHGWIAAEFLGLLEIQEEEERNSTEMTETEMTPHFWEHGSKPYATGNVKKKNLYTQFQHCMSNFSYFHFPY
jgi:hypothetical protein